MHLLLILILTLIIFIRITLNQLEKQSETIVQLRNEKLETEKKLTISKHDCKEVRISLFLYNIYFDRIIKNDAFLKAQRKLELECENRKKGEIKINELWTKLEQEQNLRSQLTHSAQVNNDKIACLEKQFAAISEKFKAETETNAKLKKSNAELTLSCNNKDKLVEEMTEKLEHLQRINTNQAHDIANLQSQLDKAHVNWMQLNDRTQDLESKIISIIFAHF